MRKKFASHLPLKEGIGYILRGYGIVRRMYPSWLAVSTVQGVLRALQPLIAVYFSAQVIEALTAENYKMAIKYSVLTVGITMALRLVTCFTEKQMNVMQQMIWEKNRLFRGHKFAKMEYGYTESREVNELNAEIDMKENTHGLGTVRIFMQHGELVQALVGTVVSAILFIGMFTPQSEGDGTFITSDWVLGVLVISLVLPILLRTQLMHWSMGVMAHVQALLPVSNAMAGYYQQYIEVERAGKDLRIYDQKESILKHMTEAQTAWFAPMSRVNSLIEGLMAAVNAIIAGLAYLLIGLRALLGLYSIGQVTQYVGALTAFSSSVTMLIRALASTWENAAYLPVLYELLDVPEQKEQGNQSIFIEEEQACEIAFCDVSFRYPNSEQWVLRHLNFKIRTGERVAVVGRNGSGKTTMIKLLCRLYEPTEGYITFNGTNISKYSCEDYFSLFSVVFQDFMLPSLQLGQVIANKREYDKHLVCNVLERVGLKLDDGHLPFRLKTYINRDFDENGVMFSGGEMQKIALARALYKAAPLVVLDEPTAALDPIAEAEIYSKFNVIVEGRTALFISHRLSSCRFCDDILVFDQGVLVQRGCHDELLDDVEGLYYMLWTSQAQYYQNDENENTKV